MKGTSALDSAAAIYGTIKADIDRRLAEFKRLGAKGTDEEIFRELCFCVCTPQNNAQKAWGAVLRLAEAGLLLSGGEAAVAGLLREEGVRFHRNKARYIAANRAAFYPDTRRRLRDAAAGKTLAEERDALQKKVAGWGLKEASHFLRNTGRGDAVCILDRHILRQLALYGVIAEVPASVSAGAYREIERKMLAFAEKEGVPPDALDLVFWYKEKGEIFK